MGKERRSICCSFCLLLSYSSLLSCAARDTLNLNQTIDDREEELNSLVSSSEVFELGFFTPPNGSSNSTRYVGIWYHKLSPQTVVWVANRKTPLPNSNGSFAIGEDGNLNVFDSEKNRIWFTNISSVTNKNMTVKLMDSGNLILFEEDEQNPVWQSFVNDSSDTFLPGMKMKENQLLCSWKSESNPAKGSFTFGLDSNQYKIMNGSNPYWVSGNSPNLNDEIPSDVVSLLSNQGEAPNTNCTTDNQAYSKVCDFTKASNDDKLTRLVMHSSGEIMYLKWSQRKWNLQWREPRDRCSLYKACGIFSICNPNGSKLCECLTGFEPNSLDAWKSSKFSGGCVRKIKGCGKENENEFIVLNVSKLGTGRDPSEGIINMETCRNNCISSCCDAFEFTTPAHRDRDEKTSCRIHTGDLNNLRHTDAGSGQRNWILLLRQRNGSGSSNTDGGGDEYDRSYKTSKGPPEEWPLFVTIAIVCFTIVSICYLGKTFIKRKVSEHRQNIQEQPSLHLDESAQIVRDISDPANFTNEKKLNDVPFFEFESIVVATDNFSISNKLGQGGFGPVYKGKFPGGQEIAVKRLSRSSGQGLEEFKNEVLLIAKLQHRNLVRLLGYCIKGDEKMLLYEYMPNKSLDSFIFDRTQCLLLNWEKRFDIIMGIARGLLYLHHDSRLRIIHRDLKTSNILLDEEMNAKISDFGLARIFEGKQTEANTNRIMGTYGYMSPEYALDGFFSIKSDVFSFGVVLLEIITGKKTMGFYQSENSLSLLGYAWRLWKEEKVFDLMDQSLHGACNISEVMKCVNVGLLCVQEEPNDRPTMSSVVFMLGSESATLPIPTEPAFARRRCLSSSASSSSKPEVSSNIELTNTLEEGR